MAGNSGYVDIEEGELERCGDELRQALQAEVVGQQVEHIKKVREIFVKSTQLGDLIDSYLEEIIDLVAIEDAEMRITVVEFIEEICQKDCNVMKKATSPFMALLNQDDQPRVKKSVIRTCTILYPVVLNWAIETRNDHEAQRCWDMFIRIKGKIMSFMEGDNEGIRTMAIKFLECVVICQSMRSELSVGGREGSMCLNRIPPDHRFISYRQMQMEASHSLQNLLDQLALPHISSQNLLAVLGCVINIARQRPDFMTKVLDSIEILHVNLPPTLGTSQVKSVRKELKMHLLRLIKHQGALPLYQRITTLLVDLGSTPSEISRATPPEIQEMLKNRKRQLDDEQRNKEEASNKKRREAAIRESKGEQASSSNVPDVVLDDADYADDGDSNLITEKPAQQSAIDVTAQYIFDRLTPKVVANLVIISLMTLPNEMPATFASSYTPIAQAGTEDQRRHLSRMIATQATAKEKGPGIEQMRKEKLKQFRERQSLRSEGGVIPPTPMHVMVDGQSSLPKPLPPKFVEPALPSVAPTIQDFDIIKDCRPFSRNEMLVIFDMAVRSVMSAEVVARKSNMYAIQNKILVRLITRFQCAELDFTQLTINFIVEDHKSRADLAILWMAELYAQYQGYSICFAHDKPNGERSAEDRLLRYNDTLTSLVKLMFNSELHKEMAFHRVFLEIPLITADALRWLKKACLDEVYGTFCMTTLREMIMTRSRQRDQLIDLLFDLSHFEGTESSKQAIAIAKEMYELEYVRSDVTRHLTTQLEYCLVEPPPNEFATAEDEPSPSQWTDSLYRSALSLYLDLLPVDPSLLHRLANIYSRSGSVFKRCTLRMIENPVKTIGIRNEHIVRMVEDCPIGAETLVARVIHVLSEKSAVTMEIVTGMKRLHETRKTDVRSLIPVLTGFTRSEIDALLPQLVLSKANQKSVGHVFRRILQGRNIDTGDPPMRPVDFIVSYHRLKLDSRPERREEQRQLHVNNLEILYSNKMITKDTMSAAVEKLLEDRPLCDLFFPTLVAVNARWPALDGFLSNVLGKVVNRELWKENDEQKDLFFKSLEQLQSVAYLVILTGFTSEEFREYLSSVPSKSTVLNRLNEFLPQLSTHQQRNMSQTILEMVQRGR